MISFCKNNCIILEKKSYSEVFNAQGIVKIFTLGAKLQPFVYDNGITFKISKLIVGHIQRFFLDTKVTLRTLCAYDHHLRTLFMERCPGVYHIHSIRWQS